MNKEQAAKRLCAIETEVEELRRIIDEPEQRKPETGDVWQIGDAAHIVGSCRRSTDLNHGYTLMHPLEEYFASSKCTYLGKFNDVYVKISDVRDALNIPSQRGMRFLSPETGMSYANNYNGAREALRKLGITNQ